MDLLVRIGRTRRAPPRGISLWRTLAHSCASPALNVCIDTDFRQLCLRLERSDIASICLRAKISMRFDVPPATEQRALLRGNQCASWFCPCAPPEVSMPLPSSHRVSRRPRGSRQQCAAVAVHSKGRLAMAQAQLSSDATPCAAAASPVHGARHGPTAPSGGRSPSAPHDGPSS